MTSTGTKPRKSLRLLGIISATLIVAIFLGTAVAVFFLDSFALLIAKPILAPYGVRLISVEGLQIRRDQVTLTRLEFMLSGADQPSQVDDLDLRFSSAGFFAMPIQQLHAQRVNIGLAINPSEITKSEPVFLPRLPRIGTLLDTLQAIPGNAVDIERLDIAPYIDTGRLSVTRNDRELRLEITAQNTSADFRVNWHDEYYVSSLLLPEQSLSNAHPSPDVITGRLLLEALGAEVVSTDFTLSESEDRLQIDARSILEIGALSAFAEQAALLPAPLLNINGQLDVTWHLSEPAPDDAMQTLPFSLAIASHSAIDSTLQSELPSGLQSVGWRTIEQLNMHGDYTLSSEALNLHVNAPSMTIALGIGQAAPAILSAALDEFNIDCLDRVTCSINHSSSLSLPELTWLDTGVRELLLVSNGTLALDQGRVEVHFAQGSRLELGRLDTATADLTEVNALVQQALDINIAENGSVKLESGGVDFYLPNIIIDGKSSQFVGAISNLSGHITETETQLKAHALLRNIGSDWMPFILRKPELEFDFSSSPQQISATGILRVADRELVQFDTTYTIETLTALAQFETPVLDFGSGTQSLAQWFFQAPFEADLVSGTLQSTASLRAINDNRDGWLLSGPIHLEAQELSGFYQDTAIIDLSTTINGQLIDTTNFISDGPNPFSLTSVDLGLPVENISLQYAINTQTTSIEVNSIEASLFGGRVHSAGTTYDWSAASNSVTIDLERIDISKLLSLAAYDSIKATGFISGTIPITLTGTKPSVDAGRLQVEAPGGAIHYSPAGGMKSGNASLDFVNQALSNYQYNLMETEVEYLPSGELELGVKLQGLNPDMNNGQRINLNLNISDNIPMLLRSLQSGRTIAEALERELQTR